jgi:hypothetical protein
VPVSEIAIFLGGIGLVYGLIEHGGPALVVGAVLCGLGVFEVTAREHFSGFRPHAALLAAFPSLGVEYLVATAVAPSQRFLLLVPVVPTFGISFWWLRRRFVVARQRRLVKLPVP